MDRLPFDPSKIRGIPDEPPEGGRARPGDDDGELSVSEAAALIKGVLERGIAGPIRVAGEIGNLSARHHWYFSLKDDDAVIGCVAWASTARSFGFRPEQGDEVIATGTVSHYPPQGRTQLYVTRLEPVGEGALEAAFRRLCETLRSEGYFEPGRKRPLPPMPRRIAVVTSAGGAAVQDVIATAAQRCPAVGLLVVDVRVQGDGAAEQVAAAIDRLDAARDVLGIDAILVTRGGGSREDLWAFNERVVADATFRCSLPIVAAIGHESDTTIIELVADLRAATPTQAAMHLVPDAGELHRQLDHLAGRLGVVLGRRLELARARLDGLARSEALARPAARLERERERLDDRRRRLLHAARHRLDRSHRRVDRLAGRLGSLPTDRLVGERRSELRVLAARLDGAVRHRLDRGGELRRLELDLRAAARSRIRVARADVESLARSLHAVDPERVLRRGFSLTTRAGGGVVRSARDVGPGDRIVSRRAAGAIASVVEPDDGAPPVPARRRSGGGSTRRRSKRDDAADGMDLFGGGQ